jgi:protein involved in polysaccharide export with SLBB domain
MKIMVGKKYLFLVFVFLFIGNSFYGQSLDAVLGKGLNSISENDIEMLRKQITRKSLSIEQLERRASANGMSEADFVELKLKIEEGKTEQTVTNLDESTLKQETASPKNPIEMDKESKMPMKSNEIFGSELFSNPNMSFKVDHEMVAPPSYILGYKDNIQIIVYGVQENASQVEVSKEGNIGIPIVGLINVGGLTFEAAKSLIRKSFERFYPTLKTGLSDISISIIKYRSIRITVLGAKRPGNYYVSSLSSVFHALHTSGGPDDNGSYRNIELIRNGKVVKKIDLYKFLVYGNEEDNNSLMENDIIRISTYTKRVRIEGNVKRKGIYELNEGETFQNLLEYCSGFDEAAYQKSVKLIQNTDSQMKIVDLYSESFETYEPRSGDVFKVSTILNRFENRVKIDGAIFRPGEYAIEDNLKLSELIKRADGLKEDAFMGFCQVIRLKDNYEKELVTVNLKSVMNGDNESDIILKREDEVFIFSIFDLKDQQSVQIGGQVRNPGSYAHLENIKLFDLIVKAGGFTDAASKRIEISRINMKDSIIPEHMEYTKIIVVDVDKDLSNENNIDLMPHDIIQVRKMPIFELSASVKVAGNVYYPGVYSLSNRGEKLSDIIERAGGLDRFADKKGIRVLRYNDMYSTLEHEKDDYDRLLIPIDYDKILKNPKLASNITLKVGDVIEIPEKSEVIKVQGAVFNASEVLYESGKPLRYYVSSVGGFDINAEKKKVYVTYSNGISNSTRNVIFFRKYPKIQPNSEVFVPYRVKKTSRKDRSESTLWVMGSMATSMATVLIGLIRLLAID